MFHDISTETLKKLYDNVRFKMEQLKGHDHLLDWLAKEIVGEFKTRGFAVTALGTVEPQA